MTVCRYIKHKKTRRDESNTARLLEKNSLNSKSLESSDSVQHNEGGQESQEDSRRKSVAGTAAHQSDLLSAISISLETESVTQSFPIPSWSRLGCTQSYLPLPSNSFLM